MIENNKEMAPFEHYTEQFQKLDPEETAARTLCSWDAARGCFEVKLLHTPYRVFHPGFRIEADDVNALALTDIPAQIYLMRFLMEGRASVCTGNFLTYREMPWGDVYLTQFTGRCLKRAAFAFGTQLEKFKAAAEQLNAMPVRYGDAAYQFEVLPGYEVRLIIWEGDDEFPPNAQLLYSDNFPIAFSAEDRTVTGDLLITELKRRIAGGVSP